MFATAEYLWDAAFSNEKYYQDKYGGFKKRLIAIIKLLNFKLWDFVWGSGEKVWKIARFLLLMLIMIVIYDVLNVNLPKSDSISYVYSSFQKSFAVFFWSWNTRIFYSKFYSIYYVRSFVHFCIICFNYG